MHVLTILQRILFASLPEIHAKRLTSLLAVVEAMVSGSRLTLSDLGRGLAGPVAVKHNIKRIGPAARQRLAAHRNAQALRGTRPTVPGGYVHAADRHRLLKLLAIPLGCPKTATKWLVMVEPDT
jgi:hypothetical protein